MSEPHFIISETEMQLALRRAWVAGYMFASQTVEGRANHFVQDMATEELEKLKQVKQ